MAENGNVAALRGALEKIKELNRYDLGCIRSRKRRDEIDAKVLEIERTVRAALSLPARNCDKYRTVKEAAVAFAAEYNSRKDASPFIPVSDFCFSTWLYAPAEGGDHA